MEAWGGSHKWSFLPFSRGAHMTTSVPAQGGVHLMGSSCGQTQPGHVQAASKMTFSKADASFGAKKTVLLMIKWALHHSTMRSRARACVCVCVCALSSVWLFVIPWTVDHHGILQARTLERAAISFSRGSFRPRDWNCFSCMDRRILYHWTTWKAPYICISGYYLF